MIELKIGESQRVMDAFEWSLQFAPIILQLIGILTWPTVILILACWFRDPLSELIENIVTISTPAGSVTVRERLKRGEELAAEAMAEQAQETTIHADETRQEANAPEPSSNPTKEKLVRITELDDLEISGMSSSDVIYNAWSLVTMRMAEVARELRTRGLLSSPTHGRDMATRTVAKDLLRYGLISPTIYDIFNQLLEIRVAVSQSSRKGRIVTHSEARRYKDLAELVLQELSEDAVERRFSEIQSIPSLGEVGGQ